MAAGVRPGVRIGSSDQAVWLSAGRHQVGGEGMRGLGGMAPGVRTGSGDQYWSPTLQHGARKRDENLRS